MEEKTLFRLFFVLTIAGVFLATSYGASEPEKKVSPELIFFRFQVFIAFTANNFLRLYLLVITLLLFSILY